jgi:hypothetical protein
MYIKYPINSYVKTDGVDAEGMKNVSWNYVYITIQIQVKNENLSAIDKSDHLATKTKYL